jgi:hypothetical protein
MLVVASLSLASVFLLLSAFSQSAVTFLLFVFLYYIAYGVREVLYPLIVERIYMDLKVLGHAEATYTIVYTAAVGIAGYIMDVESYKLAFILAAGLLIIAALSRLPFPDVRDGEEGDVELPYKDKLILGIVAMFMVVGTGMLMMLPAIPILEVRLLNLSNTVIGIALAVNSLTYVFFSELWGRVIERPSHVIRVFQLGFIAIGAMAVVYFLSTSAWYVYLASALCAIGGSAVSIGWQAFSMGIPDYRTEDLSALHLTTCGIRGLYAPLLGSLSIELVGVRRTFIIAAILVVSALFVAESLIRPLRERFEL